MSYQIKLRMPAEWAVETETTEDVDGSEITHLAASVYDEHGEPVKSLEVFAGEMPEGSNPEEQANVSFYETFGDEDEESPVVPVDFGGKEAFGYEYETGDGLLMAVLCVRIGSALCIISVAVRDDEDLKEVISLAESLSVEEV